MSQGTVIELVWEEVRTAGEDCEHELMLSYEEQVEYSEIDELRRAAMEIADPEPLTYSAS